MSSTDENNNEIPEDNSTDVKTNEDKSASDMDEDDKAIGAQLPSDESSNTELIEDDISDLEMDEDASDEESDIDDDDSSDEESDDMDAADEDSDDVEEPYREYLQSFRAYMNACVNRCKNDADIRYLRKFLIRSVKQSYKDNTIGTRDWSQEDPEEL